MYICLECGEVFDQPYTRFEPHPELDGCPSETFYVSPCCGGDYADAARCQCCGAYTVELPGLTPLCKHCRTVAKGQFIELLRSLAPEQVEFLSDWTEGKCFPEILQEAAKK